MNFLKEEYIKAYSLNNIKYIFKIYFINYYYIILLVLLMMLSYNLLFILLYITYV